MKFLPLFALVMFSLAASAHAQQPASAGTTTDASASPDRAQVEAALKKYEAAYQHISLYELQQVWPDLPDQKKEYRKAEDLMKRGDVSDLKVSVDVKDIQVTGDDAVANGVRHEQYLKNEKSSFYGGDNSMARVGTQNPGPASESDKKTMKKTQDVTMHFHRKADGWVVTSVEESGKHH